MPCGIRSRHGQGKVAHQVKRMDNSQMRGRLGVVVAVSLCAVSSAVILCGSAIGSGGLGITFDRSSAHAGDWLTGTGITLWSGTTSGITAYFTSTRLGAFKPNYNGLQPILSKPPKRGVWRLGGFGVRHRRLYIRFRVPSVPPGDYTVAFQCATCAPGGDFFLQTLWGRPWSCTPGVVVRVVR